MQGAVFVWRLWVNGILGLRDYLPELLVSLVLFNLFSFGEKRLIKRELPPFSLERENGSPKENYYASSLRSKRGASAEVLTDMILFFCLYIKNERTVFVVTYPGSTTHLCVAIRA